MLTCGQKAIGVLLVLALLTGGVHRALAQAGEGRTQTVRGTVVDAVTGEPLSGAHVVVLGTDPRIGAATNRRGEFELTGVPLGRHDVRVSFLGYRPVVRSGVLVGSGRETVLRVRLRARVFEGEEVVVSPERRKDRPLNEMAFVSARSFSVEETRRYAGGLDDPARMATAFAGVSAAGGVETNALTIRGNAPKGVQWRLEGVEIPNPSHFAGLSVLGGGGLTLFSGQLLSDADVMTGAFPAEYGNALSGVFDMRFRSGNPAQREYAAQIGVNGVELASEGPFAGEGSSTYLFNYRYSTLALLMPLLPVEGSIRYQDLSFKTDVRTSGAGRFELWGIGGWDGQAMEPTYDPDRWKRNGDRVKFDLDLGVGAAGVAHTMALGPRTTLSSSVAADAHRTAVDQQRLDDEAELRPHMTVDNTTGGVVARTHLNHRFSSRHVNRSGVGVRHLFYDVDVRVAPDDQPPLQTYTEGAGTSRLVQAFSQSRIDLSPALTLQAGLHAQRFALNGEWALEPRTGIVWRPTDTSSLHLGYGRHSQIEDLRVYFLRPQEGYPNRSLEMAKAHHVVAGYDRKLGAATRLKLEAFDQRLYDVPVIADSSYSMLNFVQDWTFDDALVNAGRGRNYGIELTLERFLDDGYYYLVTGTVYDSRYQDGAGTWRPTRFDRDFAVNLLGGKEFVWNDGANVLGLNGRISYLGGKRHSPVDRRASRTAKQVEFDERRAFEERFPNRLIVDLTLTYRANRDAYTSVWALQVKNALLEKNYYFDYNYETERVDRVAQGTPLPVLSYKIEF